MGGYEKKMSFWEKFKEFDEMMSKPAFTFVSIKETNDNEEIKELREENRKLKLMMNKLLQNEIRSNEVIDYEK